MRLEQINSMASLRDWLIRQIEASASAVKKVDVKAVQNLCARMDKVIVEAALKLDVEALANQPDITVQQRVMEFKSSDQDFEAACELVKRSTAAQLDPKQAGVVSGVMIKDGVVTLTGAEPEGKEPLPPPMEVTAAVKAKVEPVKSPKMGKKGSFKRVSADED